MELYAALVDGRRDQAKSILESQLQQRTAVSRIDAGFVNQESQSLLHTCALLGFDELIPLIIRIGVPVEGRDHEENTPFHLACQKGHLAVIKQLVSCGANIHAKAQSDLNGLHFAALNGHADVVHELIDTYRMSVSALDSTDDLPLHLACAAGHTAIVHMLYKAGSDINAQTKKGNTPLHVCVMKRHKETASMLIRLGAFTNIHNRNNQTASDIAQLIGDKDLISIFQAPSSPRQRATTSIGAGAVVSPHTVPTYELDTTKITSFVHQTGPEFILFHCLIVRETDSPHNPVYNMYANKNDGGKVLLMSTRRGDRTTRNFVLSSPNRPNGEGQATVGRIKTSLRKKEYSVFCHQALDASSLSEQTGGSKEVACIQYLDKQPRNIRVILPSAAESSLSTSASAANETPLSEKFRSRARERVMVFQSQKPVWNEETRSFALDFYGRVSVRSSKNFILVRQGDETKLHPQPFLIFGRVSRDSFVLNFSHPLTPTQAFGIAVSALDTV